MSVPTTHPHHPTTSRRPVYDMALPFNPNTLRQNAEARGLGRYDSAVFAHLALQQLRSIQDHQGDQPVTTLQVAEAIKRHAAAQLEREMATQEDIEHQGVSITRDIEKELMQHDPEFEQEQDGLGITVEEDKTDGLRKKRFKFSQDNLDNFFDGKDPYNLEHGMTKLSIKHTSHDIISALCQNVELAVELGKHLRFKDLLNLYIASSVFRHAIAGHLLSSVRSWISHNAREAGQIFSFKLYRRHLVPDPAGRTWSDQYGELCNLLPLNKRNEVRSIPGLKYLQLVMGRDRYCREIVAILARSGHRLPPNMHSTLLRLWLLMDVATTRQREALLRSTAMWPEEHLYNAQLLFVKLGMHFNDPIYGPNTYELLHLILGQKGLYPLWQLLLRKNYTRMSELMELKVRYDFELPPDHWGHDYFDKKVYNVPFDEIGLGHLEGWGRGRQHLMRPDELVPVEAVARGLELDKHLVHMMLWGFFDRKTGENLVPSEDEMHISDEESVLAQMDTLHHWRRKHALKKRFKDLTPEQQADIMEDDEDERLRAMAWTSSGDSDDEDYASDDEGPHHPHVYSLDDEINRGFILRPQPKDQPSQAPALDDKQGWADFINRALLTMPPEITEDEKLRAQAWQCYTRSDLEEDWDWERWLDRENEDHDGHSDVQDADMESGGDGQGDDDNGSYSGYDDEDGMDEHSS